MYSSIAMGGEIGITGIGYDTPTRTFELVTQTLLANSCAAIMPNYQQGLLSAPEERETIGSESSLMGREKVAQICQHNLNGDFSAFQDVELQQPDVSTRYYIDPIEICPPMMLVSELTTPRLYMGPIM